VVINNRPVKIVEYTTSKTGKHGHAKAHIIGIDIFTGKKLEELCPTTHNMDVPNVTRTEYQLLDVTNDDPPFLCLLDSTGAEKNDIRLPDGELGKQIKDQFENGKDLTISVIKAMGEEACVGSKENAGAD
jgi:translation initiation factor 5A